MTAILILLISSAPAQVSIDVVRPDIMDVAVFVNDVEYNSSAITVPAGEFTIRVEYYDDYGFHTAIMTGIARPGQSVHLALMIRRIVWV